MGAHGGAPLHNRLTRRGRPPCLPCQTEAHLKHKYEKLSCSKPEASGEGLGVRVSSWKRRQVAWKLNSNRVPLTRMGEGGSQTPLSHSVGEGLGVRAVH